MKPVSTVTSLGLAAKCAVLAAGAAVSVFSAMPAQALTEPSFQVNGFTGLFDEANWTFNGGAANTGTGSSITPTTLTLISPTGATESDTTQYLFDTNSLLATYPNLIDGIVSFTYSYTTTDTIAGKDPFFFTNGSNITQITPLEGTSFTGSRSFSIVQGNTFGFTLTNNGPLSNNGLASTVVITGFSYRGGPVAIPGPLPVLAAAAALGWSTALRRRIRLARTETPSSV